MKDFNDLSKGDVKAPKVGDCFAFMSLMNTKLKISDIIQHTLMRSEKITHKEDGKGVVKSYEMTADNQLIEATISGYNNE